MMLGVYWSQGGYFGVQRGSGGGSYEAKSAVTLRKERAFLDVSDQLSIRSIRAENFCSS